MNIKPTLASERVSPDGEADSFLAQNHEEIAAKLAAARDQIARGETAPLEPLEHLLREARGRTAR